MAFFNTKKNKFLTKLQKQFNSNIIMNWSNVHKCMLVLMLTLGMHFLWIGWKLFIITNPMLWQWVDLPLLKSQIYFNIYAAILVSHLIVFCYFFQKEVWANTTLPHIVLAVFVNVLLIDGFLVGIYSPATIFAFVSISGLGLILFDRKIFYIQLIIAITVYCTLMYCTYHKIIPYAPLFSENLLNHQPRHNLFWIVSMLYFIIPILISCFILCEVLLSQWRNQESFIKNLSQTDPLTNLYNRRFFNETLDTIQKNQSRYAIILMDIDHFKMINDQYGHHFGDEVLQRVASLLCSQTRHTDIVARYGGEEFIIALPDTSLAVAHEIAERCRLIIQNEILETVEHKNIRCTASFGVAISIYGIHINKVIHLADQALYHAKQLGRNRVQSFTDLH